MKGAVSSKALAELWLLSICDCLTRICGLIADVVAETGKATNVRC